MDHDYWKLKGEVPQDGFTACYFADKNYGELEPDFVNDNYQDLDSEWIFTDYDEIVHKVTFNQDLVFPILTDGWSELKDVFGWSDQQKFSLLYHGNSTFGIIVSDEIKSTNNIPPWHSRSTKPLRTARFVMQITNQIIDRPYLNVFDDLERLIRDLEWNHIHVCCDNGTFTIFEVAKTDIPFTTTAIGIGWQEFCYQNNFGHEDIIVFKFGPRSPYNVVHVFKL